MCPKRLILCMDGTWNNTYVEEQRLDGMKVVKPSNVLKLARAVLPSTDQDIAQVVYYDTGVGSMSDFPGPSNKMLKVMDNVLGGGWGAGFETNIEDAVTFLANNYQEGDQVFIFGFSRGAATARGLTRFIDWMKGLPTKKDVFYLPLFLRRYMETKGKVTVEEIINDVNNRKKSEKQKLNKFQEVDVELLGVWDTVMALGSKFLTVYHRRFHLSETPANCVKHVRQALAIDEKRSDFKPEVWLKPANKYQTLEQRWFVGVHANIGGGYAHDGLANIAFRWMTDQAKESGIQFDEKFLKYYRPYPQDLLIESKTFKYKFLDWVRFRNGVRSLTEYPKTANLDLHYSVISRMLTDPNAKKPNSNDPVHLRFEKYEPLNVVELLKNKDDFYEYISNIHLRDKGDMVIEDEMKEKLKKLKKMIINAIN